MPPRLRFFIVRPEVATQTPTGAPHKQLGPIVPLIPADELPDWLDVVGAPRELSVEQTMSLSNLGTVAKNDEPFPVRIAYSALDLSRPQQPQQQLPGATIDSWADEIPDIPPPQPPVDPADEMKAHWTTEPRHGLSSSIHNRPDGSPNSTASTSTKTTTHPYHTPPPSPPTAVPVPAGPTTHQHQPPVPAPAPAPSPQTQKSDDYCRHWCHHGTCKWGNQCRYQHVMPTTTQGLVDVGLREFPTWWVMGGGGGCGGGPVPHNNNRGQQHLGHDVPGHLNHGQQQLGHAAPGHLNHGQQHLGLGHGAPPAMHQQQQQQHQPFPTPPAAPAAAPGGGSLYPARLAALRHLGLLSPSSAPPPPASAIRNTNPNNLSGMGYPPLPHPHHGMIMMPLGGVAAGVPLSNKKLKAQLREVVGVLNRLGITTGPTGANVNRLVQQRKREMMMGGGGGGLEEEGMGQGQGHGGGMGRGEEGGKIEGGVVAQAQGQGVGVGLPAAVVVEEEERLLEL